MRLSAAEFVASLLDWGSVAHDVPLPNLGRRLASREDMGSWTAAAVVVRLGNRTDLVWLGQARGLLVEAT